MSNVPSIQVLTPLSSPSAPGATEPADAGFLEELQGALGQRTSAEREADEPAQDPSLSSEPPLPDPSANLQNLPTAPWLMVAVPANSASPAPMLASVDNPVEALASVQAAGAIAAGAVPPETSPGAPLNAVDGAQRLSSAVSASADEAARAAASAVAQGATQALADAPPADPLTASAMATAPSDPTSPTLDASAQVALRAAAAKPAPQTPAENAAAVPAMGARESAAPVNAASPQLEPLSQGTGSEAAHTGSAPMADAALTQANATEVAQASRSSSAAQIAAGVPSTATDRAFLTAAGTSEAANTQATLAANASDAPVDPRMAPAAVQAPIDMPTSVTPAVETPASTGSVSNVPASERSAAEAATAALTPPTTEALSSDRLASSAAPRTEAPTSASSAEAAASAAPKASATSAVTPTPNPTTTLSAEASSAASSEDAVSSMANASSAPSVTRTEAQSAAPGVAASTPRSQDTDPAQAAAAAAAAPGAGRSATGASASAEIWKAPSDAALGGSKLTRTVAPSANTADTLVAKALTDVASGQEARNATDAERGGESSFASSFVQALMGQTSAAQANAHSKPLEVVAPPPPMAPHQARLDEGRVQLEVVRLAQQGGGQVVMQLTPPDESKFKIDLTINPQGMASLVVEGASDSTRARLEQTVQGLQDQFQQMGLQLQLDMRQSQHSFQSQADPSALTSAGEAAPNGAPALDIEPVATARTRAAWDQGQVYLVA